MSHRQQETSMCVYLLYIALSISERALISQCSPERWLVPPSAYKKLHRAHKECCKGILSIVALQIVCTVPEACTCVWVVKFSTKLPEELAPCMKQLATMYILQVSGGTSVLRHLLLPMVPAESLRANAHTLPYTQPLAVRLLVAVYRNAQAFACKESAGSTHRLVSSWL
jgi:hypothetical protein